MKREILISNMILLLTLSWSCEKDTNNTGSLKEAFQNKFVIGMALNEDQIRGADTLSVEIIKKHCNSITAENCMKSGLLQPVEGEFNFELTDKFVDFGEDNNMKIIGHTLVWHSQAPDWFFTDDKGNDVSRDVLIKRIKTHIQTVVGRYKGRVQGWDVVNESIENDGSWRQNKFYTIIGEEYIALAFQFASEADSTAELYYNDFSMALEGKRKSVVDLVKSLQKQNIRIDGVGMQTHSGLQFASIEEQEKSILAFSALNVKVMITEFDVTVLPIPDDITGANVSATAEYKESINPYVHGLPDSVYNQQKIMYTNFFQLFNKHHDKIDRVTLWGVSDNQSWKNNWPIPGRTDYALLFDRNYQAKPFVSDIINIGNNPVHE